jgi:hypothetical protein
VRVQQEAAQVEQLGFPKLKRYSVSFIKLTLLASFVCFSFPLQAGDDNFVDEENQHVTDVHTNVWRRERFLNVVTRGVLCVLLDRFRQHVTDSNAQKHARREAVQVGHDGFGLANLRNFHRQNSGTRNHADNEHPDNLEAAK